MIRTLVTGILFVCAAAATDNTFAQEFPSRPVRMISSYSTGGASDIGFRVLGPALTERGWPAVLIENRPGAAGAIAAQATLQSPADGYTIYQCDIITLTVNPSLVKNLPYDPKDFTPVMMTFRFPNLLVVRAASPAKSFADLLQMAKTKPGGVIYASPGIGSGGHLLGVVMEKAAGKPMIHSPYKGGAAGISDLLEGRVDMTFSGYGTMKSLIDAGSVRPIMVSSTKRIPELPDTPSAVESGQPDMLFDLWWGLCVPSRTPAAVVKAIHDKVETTIKQPAIVKKLQELGLYVETNTPEQFRDLIEKETVRLARLFKDAGVSAQ